MKNVLGWSVGIGIGGAIYAALLGAVATKVSGGKRYGRAALITGAIGGTLSAAATAVQMNALNERQREIDKAAGVDELDGWRRSAAMTIAAPGSGVRMRGLPR